MREVHSGREGGNTPQDLGRSSSSRRSERTIRFDEDEESIRRYAEEFLVNWMALAVKNAQQKIVAQALDMVANLGDASQVDQAILDVVSGWDFSERLEKSTKG